VKDSVKHKISRLAYRTALMSIVLASLIAISGYLLLRTYIYSVNAELGKRTALSSQQSIEFQLKERLASLVQRSAGYCDLTFHTVENNVNLLAGSASSILKNQGVFRPRPVAPPNPTNNGIYSAQVQHVADIDSRGYQNQMPLLGNLQGLMLTLATNISEVNTCYIGSELGYIIVVDDTPIKPGPPVDCRTRPWYMLARENKELIWTDIYPEAYGKGLVITCAKPFYHKNGDIAGVAGVELLLTMLSDLVRDAQVDELGASFIIDDYGNILVSDEEDASLLSKLTIPTTTDKSKIESVFIEGKEYFIAFAPIHVNICEETSVKRLYFASIVETSIANAPALDNTNSILTLTDNALKNINVIVFLFIFLLVIFNIVIFYFVERYASKFSQTITTPIAVLEESVNIIANGNLQHHIEMKTNDELETLAKSVNKMATDLKIYIENLQKITAEKERIDTELDLARKIQDSMLPNIEPDFANYVEFDLCAYIQPAKVVGGDFYDFFFIDAVTLALVIGDVSGSGIPAALYMGTVKTLIKNNAKNGMTPSEVCYIVNNLLCEANEEEMFATVFLVYINIHTGDCTFVSAGHLPPLVIRDDKATLFASEPNYMLGLLDGKTYEQYTAHLQPNDKLFLYTDGVTEAMNSNEELFTGEKLLEAANKYSGATMGEFCEAVRKEVLAFTGELTERDDYTTLGIQFFGGNAEC